MMMAGPPPSYWAHQQQQQQQISMHQHNQLLDMPPSTSSQDNGGDFLHSGGPGGYSQTQPLSESSVFNGGNGTGPNSTAFQQQFQDFQQFPLIKTVGQSQQQFPCMDNFSPGHNTNGRFAGQQNTRQQLHHQQISSPSVTSTADFLSNPSAQQQQMMVIMLIKIFLFLSNFSPSNSMYTHNSSNIINNFQCQMVSQDTKSAIIPRPKQILHLGLECRDNAIHQYWADNRRVFEFDYKIKI
jgi:hypothetical protein